MRWSLASEMSSLAEAHARIQAHPDRYIDHVYGETENGGTSYLILSHVPFSELGLPEIDSTPIKNISETLAAKTIPSALILGAVLTAVTVGFDKRKQKIQSAKETPVEPEEEKDTLA